MIRIEICPSHRGSSGYYRSTGHAGPGNELICNSVSSIEECLAANLLGTWNVKTVRKAENGNYILRWYQCDRKGQGIQRANTAAGFAYNGLRALANAYPGILEVTWKRPADYGRETK